MWIFVHHERPSQQAVLIHPMLKWISLMGSVWTKEPGEKGAMPMSVGDGKSKASSTQACSRTKRAPAAPGKAGHRRRNTRGRTWDTATVVSVPLSFCLPSLLPSPQSYCKAHGIWKSLLQKMASTFNETEFGLDDYSNIKIFYMWKISIWGLQESNVPPPEKINLGISVNLYFELQ